MASREQVLLLLCYAKENDTNAFGVYKELRVVVGIAQAKACTMKKELQIVRLQRNI